MRLRPYQTTIIEQIRAGFRRGQTRQLVQSPTGSGKTVLFAYMTSEAQARGLRVMVIAHRSEILDQISETLKAFSVDHGHVRSGIGMDITKTVLIASVQTLVRRLDSVPVPNLIIIDEAHHSAASQFVQVFARYPKSLFVGVTATPERLDGKGLGEFFQSIVLGPSVQWLIDGGFLKKPIYYAPQTKLDLKGVKLMGGDFSKSDLAEVMDKKAITGDAVSHYRRLGRNLPAVGFAVNLQHAGHMAAAFCDAGIPSEVIDGSLSGDDRRAMKARLQTGQTKVLMSCELVSEGFDLPSVGCAILCRPTASLGLHLQQLGRALRPSKETEAIILDHAGNCLRHGLAEEDREWSLEGQSAKRRKTEAVLETRQCVSCFAVYTGTRCPQCGAERISRAKEIEIEEGELKRLELEKHQEQQQRRIKVNRAKTYQELVALGKEFGYKPGWAWQRWQWKSNLKKNG